MEQHKPIPLAELKKLHSVVNANVKHKENLSKLDTLALWITSRIGTMGFFFAIFTWTVLWLGWNILAPHNLQFDPFPAFVLWLFISNMIQIFLMPLLMIGQNIQGRHSEARAESDFDTDTKAEIEIETILEHLENQNEIMSQILHRLDNANTK